MSAWVEAAYVIQEMRKSLISSQDIEKLKNRHTIIADANASSARLKPENPDGLKFSEESIWFVLDTNDLDRDNYVISVIDTSNADNFKPAHENEWDDYLDNSLWLIVNEG